MNQLARRIARKIVDSNSEYGDQVEKIRVIFSTSNYGKKQLMWGR